jgi:hypothetical protein
VGRLLVTASVVSSSPILVTPMKEALSSSKHRFLQEPHCVTYQKRPFFIILLTVAFEFMFAGELDVATRIRTGRLKSGGRFTKGAIHFLFSVAPRQP